MKNQDMIKLLNTKLADHFGVAVTKKFKNETKMINLLVQEYSFQACSDPYGQDLAEVIEQIEVIDQINLEFN